MRAIVILLILVFAGPTAWGQGIPRGTTSPSVIDAQGRFVGEVIGIGSGVATGAGIIRFELGAGDSVLVPVGRRNRALTWVQVRDVFFESTNCTGVPLLPVGPPELAERLSVVVGSVLWYSEQDPAPVAGLSFHSTLRWTGNCDASGSGAGGLVRLSSSVDLEPNFTSPLRLVEGRARPVR